MGLHKCTVWVHYKASHNGQLHLPLSRFKNLVRNDFIIFFGMKNTLWTKKMSIFPNICWCCYCQFDNCDICIFHREVLVLLSWGFFVWFFSLPPSRQLSVLKELMTKYWTSIDNIYLEQYKSLAISFSLKKILIWNYFSLEKKAVLINLFKTVLIELKFVKVFYLNVSEWNILSSHFESALILDFIFLIFCYKTFKISLA